jgi:hypothetical protein
MENFLSQITLHFNDNPEKVIKSALRYYYKLDDMLFIMYCYYFNLKDPFIEKKYYIEGLKVQGIRHIINTLYTIYTMINKEENKTLSELVMSDYQIG